MSCHLSQVRFYVPGVMCHVSLFLFLLVKLFCGRSVINGATPSSFLLTHISFRFFLFCFIVIFCCWTCTFLYYDGCFFIIHVLVIIRYFKEVRVSHVIDNTHLRNELCPELTKDEKYPQNCCEYNHQCLYRSTALSNIIYIVKIFPI